MAAPTPRVGFVVGNPKPASRTMGAARMLVADLGFGLTHSLDLVELGADLLDWTSSRVGEEIRAVQRLDLLIVASPTYKATYTGLLKLFLERFESGHGLRGVVAVPLMLGGSAHHALAAEIHLKPVLTELGAVCPTPALYLLDDDEQAAQGRAEWIAAWGPTLLGALPN